MSIKRKLDVWRKAGLLSDEQASKIAHYEEEHSGGSHWVVWGISAVGGLAIATGIISVIAANWDNIPEWLKLTLCSALLLGSLGGAWRTTRLESSWPRDLFLLLHNGMVLATIGLVAQIYHLHGHPWRALALCAILALPAAIIASHSLLTDVFLGHITFSLGFLLSEAGWFDRADRDFGVGFLAASLGLSFLLCVRPVYPFRAVAAAALRRWGIGLISIASIGSCVLWYEHTHQDWNGETYQQVYWPIGIFGLILFFYAGRELVFNKPGRNARLLALVSLFALLAGAALTYTDSYDAADRMLRQFVGFGLFCALCASFAVVAANAGNKFGTNFATLSLAGRVLVLYFELAKNLMTTGVGLIVTGGVCLGIAYGWWQLRPILPIAPQVGGAS